MSEKTEPVEFKEDYNSTKKRDDEWPKFIVDYNYEGHRYSFELYAQDWKDAERRLKTIKNNAWVEGEIYLSGSFVTPKSLWNMPRVFLRKLYRGFRAVFGLTFHI